MHYRFFGYTCFFLSFCVWQHPDSAFFLFIYSLRGFARFYFLFSCYKERIYVKMWQPAAPHISLPLFFFSSLITLFEWHSSDLFWYSLLCQIAVVASSCVPLSLFFFCLLTFFFKYMSFFFLLPLAFTVYASSRYFMTTNEDWQSCLFSFCASPEVVWHLRRRISPFSSLLNTPPAFAQLCLRFVCAVVSGRELCESPCR